MNISVPIDNIDSARAEAAIVALNDMNKKLGAIGLQASAIPQKLISIYGITWDRRVLMGVKTDTINKLMQRLRNLQLKQSEYDRLTPFFQQAFLTASAFPPDLSDWGVLAEIFRLDLQHGWKKVLAEVACLSSRGVSSPQLLSEVQSAGVEVLRINTETAEIARSLWGIARTTFAPAASSSSYLIPSGQGVNAVNLTTSVKLHSAQYAETGRRHVHLSKKLKQGRLFAKLGPMRKISKLRASRIPPATIDRFCEDSEQANLLKQVRGSIPGLTSAFRFYTAFFHLRELTPFPPTEEKVAPRRCVFNDNATFGNYVSYLQK